MAAPPVRSLSPTSTGKWTCQRASQVTTNQTCPVQCQHLALCISPLSYRDTSAACAGSSWRGFPRRNEEGAGHFPWGGCLLASWSSTSNAGDLAPPTDTVFSVNTRNPTGPQAPVEPTTVAPALADGIALPRGGLTCPGCWVLHAQWCSQRLAGRCLFLCCPGVCTHVPVCAHVCKSAYVCACACT